MSLNGGYAMIKYNSTQEELQIAYRSKKPVLFYDENQRSHWAVIEETATQSIDEETQEPITLYEYSYKLIDEASYVVANPTLSGDEATLDGLEVDGTKYKVGGGSKLYKHDIFIQENGSGHFIQTLGLTIYTTNNSPIAFLTLPNYFPPTYDRGYSCTGYSLRDSVVAGVTNYYESFHNEAGSFYARPMFSNAIDILSKDALIIDTVTEV